MQIPIFINNKPPLLLNKCENSGYVKKRTLRRGITHPKRWNVLQAIGICQSDWRNSHFYKGTLTPIC